MLRVGDVYFLQLFNQKQIKMDQQMGGLQNNATSYHSKLTNKKTTLDNYHHLMTPLDIRLLIHCGHVISYGKHNGFDVKNSIVKIHMHFFELATF